VYLHTSTYDIFGDKNGENKMSLIIPQEVETGVASATYKYYQSKGYKIPTRKNYYGKECFDFGNKIKVNVLDLMPVSHVKVKIQCDYCGEFDYVEWVKVIGSLNNEYSQKISCHKCNGQKLKELKQKEIIENGKINPLYWNKDWLYNEYIIKDRTADNISKQCNVHIRRIERYIKNFDFHKFIDPREKLPKDLLNDLYITQKLTPQAIAEQYQIDRSTVLILLNEYNITQRNRYESMSIYYNERGGRELKSITNKEIWRREGYKEKQIKKYRIASNKLENRIKQSAGIQGIDISDWNGFLTSKNTRFRNNAIYKDWVKSVFERDNYTCQCCGARSGKGNPVTLNAHHIKSFSKYPELRLDIDNGITLCSNCHSPQAEGSFHNLYGTRNNTPEQLNEYIINKKLSKESEEING